MIGGEANDELFARLQEMEQQLNPMNPAPISSPSLDSIADQLALHYPHIIILVATKDQENDETTLRYAWRGGYFTARGMAHRLIDIMADSGQEEEE